MKAKGGLDPNCLHCQLAPALQAFLDDPQHKDVPREQLAGNIAQLLGEFLGNQLHQRGKIHLLEPTLQRCFEVASASAIEVIRARERGEHLDG